jgi:molybdate transport system substrate-binding protein
MIRLEMKMRFARTAACAAALLALPTLGACSGTNDTTDSTTAPASSAAATAAGGELVVMAAGPLKPALDKAKTAFEAANPGVTVTLNYGHVPSLMSQLGEGVPADVLVTPDAATMKSAQDKGFVATAPTPVAGNPLALVVPKGNPGKVADVKALADSELSVGVCAAELPCGKLTEELAKKAGITISADTQEPGGSAAIVTKAAAGEIQVGVVFSTDIKAGGDKVAAIPIDTAVVVVGQVSAAPLKDATNAEDAASFVAFLASPQGAAIFTAAGFNTL